MGDSNLETHSLWKRRRRRGLEDKAWNVFAESGRVEDYLRYRRENRYQENERKPGQEGTAFRDGAGEEAVWENPLR